MRRYLQLDALRGLFLIIMTLDHFGGIWPRLFYQRVGFVTAAEGFVFLSGIVAGMVYGRYRDRRILISKSVDRCFTIYKYHIFTVVVLFLLMNTVTFYDNYWSDMGAAAFSNFSFTGLMSAVLLIYQPPFVDILTMYIFFVLLMPFMIYLLQQEKIWLFWMVTLLLWVFGFLLGKPDILFSGTIFTSLTVEGYFNFLSWQVIFFIGIYLGFKKKQSSEYTPKFTGSSLLLVTSIVVFFFITKNLKTFGFTHVQDLINNDYWYHFFFNKIRLGIGRVANFLAIGYIVAFVLMKYNNLFKYSWLVILGQSSIKVFTVHLITWFFFRPLVSVVSEFGLIWHSLFSLSMLLPLYIVVFKDLPVRTLFEIKKKQLIKD